MEPELKKKNKLDNILHNQTIITCATIFVVLMIIIGASYALLSSDDKTKDISIKVGSMEAVLNSTSETLTFMDDNKYAISDSVGLETNGYDFSLINTGTTDIGYYEIRLINQENKDSTLPHKYVRFSVNNSSPNTLADANDLIYYGKDLKVGEKKEFNLKLWLNEKNSIEVLNKELYGALEVTLYQQFEIYDNFILYDMNGGDEVMLRTRIIEPITSFIPTREGYSFNGWGETKDGIPMYVGGSEYSNEKGTTLYAIWSIDNE